MAKTYQGNPCASWLSKDNKQNNALREAEALWIVACQERLSEVFDFRTAPELPWQECRLHSVDRERNSCQESSGYHYAIMFAAFTVFASNTLPYCCVNVFSSSSFIIYLSMLSIRFIVF